MTGVIIQARMDSTRLPGKVLLPIAGKPMLELILNRLSQLNNRVVSVVATSTRSIDDRIEEFCTKNDQAVFRGSEDNVLKRYLLCAIQYGFTNIVRLTGDNPFVDPEELDRLITLHMDTRVDYSSSIAKLPIGVGAEIFTMNCLEISAQNATEPHHFEHVNEYLFENIGMFRVTESQPPLTKNRPDVRLTVDTDLDYQRACFIVERAGSSLVSTEKAIDLASEFDSICSASA